MTRRTTDTSTGKAWTGSGASRGYGYGWGRTVARILKRDRHICHVCRGPGANQVDHVVPRWRGGSDDDANLAAIHAVPCHKAKTAAEAVEARAAKQQADARNRRAKHPGLL